MKQDALNRLREIAKQEVENLLEYGVAGRSGRKRGTGSKAEKTDKRQLLLRSKKPGAAFIADRLRGGSSYGKHQRVFVK